MTGAERKAARKRCDAATKGPWENDSNRGVRCVDLRLRVNRDGLASKRQKEESIFWDMNASKRRIPNYDFCAHARTDLPAALDALDATIHALKQIASYPPDYDGDEGPTPEMWAKWAQEIAGNALMSLEETHGEVTGE